jgi:hypothetical protein
MLISLLWVTVMLVAQDAIPILGAIILVLSGPYYLYLNKLRHDAQRQFQGDSHYAPAPAPRLDPEPAVSA